MSAEKRRVMANDCFEHLGGHLGSILRDRVLAQGWLEPTADRRYRITEAGIEGFERWGIDVRPLLEDRT